MMSSFLHAHSGSWGKHETGLLTTCRGELFRRAARIYLLWMLVEDALRKENTFTPDVVESWHDELAWLSQGIQPLVRSLRRVTSESESTMAHEFAAGICYARRLVKLASQRLGEANGSPVVSVFAALNDVRRARLAVCALLRQMGLRREHDALAANWSNVDLFDVGQAERRLRQALDVFLAVCDGTNVAMQCVHSRQLFLALYWTATFDEHRAQPFYELVLDGHTRLVYKMPHGATREYMRQRLELLGQIPPEYFERSAMEVAMSTIDLLPP